MGEIAPEKQFHPLSTIFYYLMLNFYVKTGIRFSLRDKRLFEITEVEITRVDCICMLVNFECSVNILLVDKPSMNHLTEFAGFILTKLIRMGRISGIATL